MSREIPVGGSQWSLWCNSCDHKDKRTYASQPELGLFAEEGWFIGAYLDACPSCASTGTHGFAPHPLYSYSAAVLR